MQYITNSWIYEYDTIVLDLNGTLTVYGDLDARVHDLIVSLMDVWYRIILLTGDQRWNSFSFDSLGIEVVVVTSWQEKRQCVENIWSSWIIAIWNARIDIGMFDVSHLRIATLQSEWIHASIVSHVDIIVPSIVDALQLLIDHDVFAATMKI